MKKPLLIVATMVALAGCHSGASSQAQHQSSGSQSGSSSQQDPASASAAASAANAPKPNMPVGQADQDSFSRDTSSQGSAGQGWSSQSSAGSQSGDLGGVSRSTQGPDVEVGDAAGADKGTSVQTPDKKNDGQRGSVLTNDGAITPSANSRSNPVDDAGKLPSTSSESTHSSNADAAERATTRSLHLPAAVDSPKSADQDAQSGTQSGAVSDGSDAGSDRRDPAITDATTLGETDSDRRLSQQIRQAVVNDETLSLASKSVQIQSKDGQVILKGQVDSDREKARIGSTAFRESGGKLVINQLEVSGR